MRQNLFVQEGDKNKLLLAFATARALQLEKRDGIKKERKNQDLFKRLERTFRQPLTTDAHEVICAF